MKNILSSHYFGNIQYFSKLVNGRESIIDVWENHAKQTYRNRCDIMGANGVLSLTVPVVKVHNAKRPMRDIVVDYATSWQKQHYRSVLSAYKNSPYFDYYIDKIECVFEKEAKFLIDLNMKTLEISLDLMNISSTVDYSTSYIEKDVEKVFDFRDVISPKFRGKDEEFSSNDYYQVFSERADFVENLSILDLIFCEGPSAKMYLENSNCVVK